MGPHLVVVFLVAESPAGAEHHRARDKEQSSTPPVRQPDSVIGTPLLAFSNPNPGAHL